MPHNRAKYGGGNGGGDGGANVNVQNAMENSGGEGDAVRCCVPTGCQQGSATIDPNDLSGVVKVICNNDNCHEGVCMHRDCFDEWEQTVLTYLKSTGRARSWSEKQRLQNLWTKKGYDLAYKACSCRCSKGHLRKDLNWVPPAPPNGNEDSKKKKNRKKKNDKPTLNMPTSATTGGNREVGRPMAASSRARTSSLSGSSCSSSPPSSAGSFDVGSPGSPSHVPDRLKKSSSTKFDYHQLTLSSEVRELCRERRDSGGSLSTGLGTGYVHSPNKFSRRQDFSSFSTLPRHKINSYHIKMEDDHDETRQLILSSVGAAKTNKVSCVLCHGSMIIFDRYPLIDGTFFLSPRQHARRCVPVHTTTSTDGGPPGGGGGRTLYLHAVCMSCLEGWSTSMTCRYCHSTWSGSSLILGTMYSYDIFAATPCCPDRLKCNNCHRMILMPDQRLQYFSDYSRSVPCPTCAVIDFHFIKSLSTYNRRSGSLNAVTGHPHNSANAATASVVP